MSWNVGDVVCRTDVAPSVWAGAPEVGEFGSVVEVINEINEVIVVWAKAGRLTYHASSPKIKSMVHGACPIEVEQPDDWAGDFELED